MSKDKNITGLTSLRFNSQNGVSVAGGKIDNADSSSQTRGLALPQVLDDTQRDKIVNSDNPTAPILFGTAVYNIDVKSAQIAKADVNGKTTWANIGTGNLSNNGNSTDTAIVIFDGMDGTKVKDSTIKIANVPSITDPELANIKTDHIVIFTDDNKSAIKDSTIKIANVPSITDAELLNIKVDHIVIFTDDNKSAIKDSTIKIANVPNVADGELGNIKANHIVIFTDDGLTKIKDGGFTVQKDVTASALGLSQTNQDRYLMSNFGAIEFINGDGSVLLDSLSAFTLHTQGVGASARACTVFSGDLPAGSSSPSAVLEINTTEGVLLLSRLSTPDEETLDTLKSGSFWYNKDLNKYRICENGNIISLGSGGSGGISPTGTITKNGIAVWDDASGSLLKSSTTVINSLGGITISASGYQNGIGANGNVYDHNGTTYTIATPTLAVPDILTFIYPSNQPIAGYILTTDNNGNTEWISKSAVNISNLTSSANSYALQNDEHFIAVDTSISSQEILLPISSTVSNGTRYLIKDAKGFAGINNITIKTTGTDLIEGNTQISINTNYGFIEVINNQNNQWLII